MFARRNKAEARRAQLQSGHPHSLDTPLPSSSRTLTTADLAFPLRLNYYTEPPMYTLSVDEFELAALNRLRLLKGIEAEQLRNVSESQLAGPVKALEDEHMPLNAMHGNMTDLTRIDAERKNDNLSHFVLRLAYARSADLRAWFVRQETALFKFRLHREDTREKNKFLRTLDLGLAFVSPAEKDSIRNSLVALQLQRYNETVKAYPTPTEAAAAVDTCEYFKVAWTRVLREVGARACLVRGGMAYIGQHDLEALVVADFKTHLTQQLELTSRFLPRMDEDERLMPVLGNLSKQYLGRDQYNAGSGSTGRVSAGEVDGLAPKHFPLCMRHLHSQLKHAGHLRHGGRMQYGLFLKGIGLPIEESLAFWRTHFRHMTDDQFQKNHAYNIRHNYGLEGKRANYAPFSCVRIITSNPPAHGDHHGCPFKHFNADNLRAMVTHAGASDMDAAAIVDLARKGHFQIACTKLAEVTTGRKVDPIEHPNQFYVQSRMAELGAGSGVVELLEADSGAAGGDAVVAEPTLPR
ncbi:eukaryotic and archaeal DNA primase, large subunit-domain-containing protein [Blastocladiella britannica]|nr:eukaryotic and archaeal DNA primase, large subunit-domain-containing protein [Blastocladiella britannica]